MKISLNWLREFLDLPENPEALGQILTGLGLPVDAMEGRTLDLTNFVVGIVREAERHPNADKLTLCRVDVGGEVLQIICGAPNAAVGVRAAVALTGAVLPDGTKIKRAKLRGVESNGMMCSERELGLSTEHKGIIDLGPAGPPAGTPLSEVLGGGDVLFDLDIASNRGDCFSHFGVARELAGALGRPLRRPETAPAESGPPTADLVRVRVEDPEGCPRYLARLIEGVRVGPSPEWLVKRLASIGQRSINNVVDVTNLILWELGQPLHAFDADRVEGREIVVRRARPGETLRTLDGVERALSPEVLVIADPVRALALAGLMGGAESEVTDGTVNILLEGAQFHPYRVLLGTRGARLNTDASIRFIRGVDPNSVADALDRGARLIMECAGGTVRPGRAEVTAAGVLEPRQVVWRAGAAERLLGEPIGDDDALDRLRALGYTVAAASSDRWTLTVPSHRRDVRLECDLVEDVARLHGYDRIGERSYNAGALGARRPARELGIGRVRQALLGLGFSEMLTRALVDPADQERAGVPTGAESPLVEIPDPPSREEASLRAALLPGALRVVSHNLRHGARALRLFEVGPVFRPRSSDGLADETHEVLLVATPGRFGPDLTRLDPEMDPARFKGLLEAFLDVLRVDTPRVGCYDETDFEPRTSGLLEARDGAGQFRSIGRFGRIRVDVAEAWGIDSGLLAAVFDLDGLLACVPAVLVYREPSRYPASTRDMAFLVGVEVPEARVADALRKSGGEWLRQLTLFDRYLGPPLPEGTVSLAYALTWQADDRTLSDDDVRAGEERIVAALRTEFGAVLRDGAASEAQSRS